MMKSFFKKLAFVMALAMVVSLAAPAATTASAAEEMKIGYQNGAVITELNLTEARSSEDLKPVGAPSNWKELGITWISSNPAVATVDNAGVVTAVSAGTAELMVTCGDYTATIPVNCFADAKAYDVTIGVDGERSITEKTLKVGEEFDFKFFGVMDYGRDKVNNAPRYFCEWDSTDTAVATVDKNGLVEAVAPGKAKITLIVWNLATGTKHNVTPTWVTVEEDKPAVVAPTVEAKQTSENVAELTFSDKNITKEALEAGLKGYYMIGDTKVENVVAIDEVKDGVAKVRSYANFVEGFTYVYTYGDLETSIVAYIGKPVSIVPSLWNDNLKVAGKAYTNYNTYIGYKIYNEKGMDITTTAMTSSTASVEISLLSDVNDGSFTLDTYNREIYFTQAGKVATIKMDYFTGDVDANGNRVIAATATLPIVSEKEPVYGMAYLSWYNTTHWNGMTISTDDVGMKEKWVQDATGTWVPSGTYESKKPTLVAVFVDTENQEVKTHELTDVVKHIGHFSFKSTKDSVVSVDNNGELTANAPGTASILVYYDYDLLDNVAGSVVGVVPVTVIGSRNVTTVSAKLDSTSSTIATFKATDAAAANEDVNGLKFDEVKFKISVKDQLGAAISHEKYANIVCNNKTLPTAQNGTNLVNYLQMGGAAVGTVATDITPADTGVYYVTLKAPAGTFAAAYKSGYTYSFTVTVDDKVASFSVTVKSPNYDTNGNIVNNAYELSGANTVDIAINKYQAKSTAVAFYNVSNGVHYGIVDMAPVDESATGVAARVNGAFYYKVVAAATWKGNITDGVREGAQNQVIIPLASKTTKTLGSHTFNFVDKWYGTDTYSVSVYQATATAGALKLAAQKSVVVKDTQDSLSYAGKQQNFYTAYNNACTIEDLVMESFKFKLGNTTWTKADDTLGTYKNAEQPVYFDVVYNVNDGTNASINTGNVGTFTPGEVYYVEKIYFYVPFDGDIYDGDPAGYVKYEVKVNDYVVIK